jgi:putative nucleotidyltransferase with HDIG domain
MSMRNKTWEQLEDQFDWVRVMKDVPQDKKHHAEGNVAVHTQMVLATMEKLYIAQTPQDQEILWTAALLHDVEKRSTTVIEKDGSITSAGHARKGEMTARQILFRDIPTPFHVREQIAKLVRFHGVPLWLFERTDPMKMLVMLSLQVNTQHLALLARADVQGRICDDQAEMLYRIDCFEELCREQGCWGTPKSFVSGHARMNYLQKENVMPDYVPYEQPETSVVIMSGLPGAGKDTYVRRHYSKLPVVSLDDIRIGMKISALDKSGNGKVIQAAKEQARVYLRNKQPFVWNATNITRQMREQLISLCLQYNAHITVVYVEVPYKELFRQNSDREAIVPAAVMQKLINKLEVPDLTEAHEVVYHLGIK